MAKELNYLECVKLCMGDKYILCNNVQDDVIFMDDVSVYLMDKYENEDVEFFQYFITGASEGDVRYNDCVLNGALDLVYNTTLDLYILCVPHFGTPWSGVYGTTIEQ